MRLCSVLVLLDLELSALVYHVGVSTIKAMLYRASTTILLYTQPFTVIYTRDDELDIRIFLLHWGSQPSKKHRSLKQLLLEHSLTQWLEYVYV